MKDPIQRSQQKPAKQYLKSFLKNCDSGFLSSFLPFLASETFAASLLNPFVNEVSNNLVNSSIDNL